MPGVVETAWAALPPGGRLVINAVTLETEARLAELFAEHGGTMRRLAVSRLEPVGGMHGWRAAMPVTQWDREEAVIVAGVGFSSAASAPRDRGSSCARRSLGWTRAGDRLATVEARAALPAFRRGGGACSACRRRPSRPP